MSQVERIAFVDRRLRERGWVTAAEVAQRFEVSARQVKRDIEYLRWRLDAPIAYDAAHHRYRYEKPWNQLRFADERKVLFSALVKGWASGEAHRDLVSADILAGIEAAVSKDYRTVADRIVYEAPWSEAVNLEVFSELCRGLRDHRVVELDYVNLEGQASRRRVEVQRLWNYAGVWYLVAWDHLRGGLRTFHLGRVQHLVVTADPTTKDEADPRWAAEVAAWTATGSGIYRGGEAFLATVRLRGRALRLASDQKWHPGQVDGPGLDSEGPYLDRTLPVVETPELLARILGYGADAEALSPASFRTQWEDEVDRLVRRRSGH